MYKNMKLLTIMLLVILLTSCGKSNTVDYNIEEVKDIHIGNTKRYIYYVIVNEKVTDEDLKQISNEVLKIAKKETPFNGLAIYFNDYPEYINDGFTLGQSEYSPNGVWSDASTVKTGDYSNMEFIYDFKTNKNWDNQLTEDEVKIWAAWQNEIETAWENIDPSTTNMPSEDDVTEKVSEDFNVSFDTVKSILDKKSAWTYEG